MNNEHYPFEPDKTRTVFNFESTGPLGSIKKSIVFDRYDGDIWNLAFGDLDKNGVIDDEVVSNNGDIVRVISTVVQATVLFSNEFPARKIVIFPVDEKRKMLYNTLIKRHFQSFGQLFLIFGDAGFGLIRFDPKLDFEHFLLIRRNT